MIRRWLRSPRTRRGLALGIVVLATGGLVLARAPAISSSSTFGIASGANATTFSGPGASGTLSLSQTKVLASSGQTVFAELRLKADESRAVAEARAPLSLAIVLDTSGSMSGEKIESAKRSVISLIRQMRDDDEVAVIRYDTSHEVIQSLARVGSVRSTLIDRISQLSAGGGTNIPPALSEGLNALSDARSGRVRRVVLVSDGLDSGRPQSERLALSALDSHTTVSALGIGLDFDEGYMSSVANAGRGNFGFVENAGALSRFLQRELEETAKTVVESAQAKLELPAGARFVRAVGAQASVEGNELTLSLGSLFAGDERRVVVELAVDAEHGESLPIDAQVSWQRVGGDRTNARLAELSLTGDRDSEAVLASRDGRVYASALSATASLRQIEASEAYARGDSARADQLMQQNQIALKAAVAAAPAEEKAAFERQAADVSDTRSKLSKAPPGSPAAKAAGKASAWKSSENLSRKVY
jgi:Ca-activated chloride channel family protein